MQLSRELVESKTLTGTVFSPLIGLRPVPVEPEARPKRVSETLADSAPRREFSLSVSAIEQDPESRYHAAEDGQLLRMLAEGESEAFWVLWLRHRKYLFAICMKRLSGAPEDAEDVLSRSMLRAWEKLPSQAWKIENPKAWLARLTMNLCVDAYREKKRREAGCENIDEATSRPETHPALCGGQSPEQKLLRGELSTRVQHALGALPPHIRSPFILHFVDGFPCRDVGDRLFLTSENVRKRIQRARSLLRKSLAPYLAK